MNGRPCPDSSNRARVHVLPAHAQKNKEPAFRRRLVSYARPQSSNFSLLPNHRLVLSSKSQIIVMRIDSWKARHLGTSRLLFSGSSLIEMSTLFSDRPGEDCRFQTDFVKHSAYCLLITPHAMRSPELPEGSVFISSALA